MTDLIKLQNLLIISGNGRNTGKTSFACRLISYAKDKFTVTAIKISPHFHNPADKPEILIANDHYRISLETDPWSSKDSSRMIAAGAQKVYYIEVKDAHLKDAMNELIPLLPLDGPIVCESGGLRNLLQPSLLVLLNEPGREDTKDSFKKLSLLADCIVLFDGSNFNFSPDRIQFDGTKWVIS